MMGARTPDEPKVEDRRTRSERPIETDRKWKRIEMPTKTENKTAIATECY